MRTKKVPSKSRVPQSTAADDISTTLFPGYYTARELAKKIPCSPTTAGHLVHELDLPFVVFRNRKYFRFSAIEERLHQRETTLGELETTRHGLRRKKGNQS